MPERGFNVGVFRSQVLDKHLIRPNLFHVEFNMPPGLQGIESYQKNINTVRTLEYWCEATTLPGVILNTYQAQRYGYGSLESRPILPVYGEQQFEFIFDGLSDNYNLFSDWINMIINCDAREGPNEKTKSIGGTKGTVPFELAYKVDYMVDTSIILYDQLGDPVKKITLRESFPKAIGDIRIAWIDNNSYMRLPVTMAYTDWFVQELEEQEPPVAPPPPQQIPLPDGSIK